MVCLQCGNELKNGAKFCGKCGKAVPTAAVPTAVPAAAVQEVEKRCASCGTALKDGAKFCPKCGGAVQASVSPVPPLPSASIHQQATVPPSASNTVSNIPAQKNGYAVDPFYAINKMVDLAESGAVQKQMISSMNDAIATMRVPGVDNPMPGTVKQKETEEKKTK